VYEYIVHLGSWFQPKEILPLSAARERDLRPFLCAERDLRTALCAERDLRTFLCAERDLRAFVCERVLAIRVLLCYCCPHETFSDEIRMSRRALTKDMSDPVVWGPVAWRAQLDLAFWVDLQTARNPVEGRDTVADIRLLLTTLSFVYPCPKCSAYAIEYVNACPVPRCLIAQWIYDMKACIDSKIKTLQFGKHRPNECLPSHLSLESFYERKSVDDYDPVRDGLDDWSKFLLVAWRKIEKSPGDGTRALAFNVGIGALGRILKKDATRISTLGDLKSLLRSWGAPVETSDAWAARVAR
jgi:hypothetical protein